MIYITAKEEHRHTFDRFFAGRGKSVASSVAVVSFERLFQQRTAPVGSYIFSDLERLAPWQAEWAAGLWNSLEAHGERLHLLNHPTRVLRRYALLRQLHELGINDSNVYRLTEARMPTRYPVFLRVDYDHIGARTGLLHTPEELQAAIATRDREGKSPEGGLIIEFCDTADAGGVYRKYAAFVVQGRVIPRGVFFSRHWMIKEPDLLEDDLLRIQRGYLEQNPHEKILRKVFEVARIDYGRVDYALRDGRVQIWEINTNPTLPTIPGTGGSAAEFVNGLFAERFCNVVQRIAQDTAQSTACIETGFPAWPGSGRPPFLARLRARLDRRRKRAGPGDPMPETPHDA